MITTSLRTGGTLFLLSLLVHCVPRTSSARAALSPIAKSFSSGMSAFDDLGKTSLVPVQNGAVIGTPALKAGMSLPCIFTIMAVPVFNFPPLLGNTKYYLLFFPFQATSGLKVLSWSSLSGGPDDRCVERRRWVSRTSGVSLI